ncbi:MAG: hypothetical protein DRP85_09540, partial [Candidatus Makaraimicrobium thalassicum]
MFKTNLKKLMISAFASTVLLSSTAYGVDAPKDGSNDVTLSEHSNAPYATINVLNLEGFNVTLTGTADTTITSVTTAAIDDSPFGMFYGGIQTSPDITTTIVGDLATNLSIGSLEIVPDSILFVEGATNLEVRLTVKGTATINDLSGGRVELHENSVLTINGNISSGNAFKFGAATAKLKITNQTTVLDREIFAELLDGSGNLLNGGLLEIGNLTTASKIDQLTSITVLDNGTFTTNANVGAIDINIGAGATIVSNLTSDKKFAYTDTTDSNALVGCNIQTTGDNTGKLLINTPTDMSLSTVNVGNMEFNLASSIASTSTVLDATIGAITFTGDIPNAADGDTFTILTVTNTLGVTTEIPTMTASNGLLYTFTYEENGSGDSITVAVSGTASAPAPGDTTTEEPAVVEPVVEATIDTTTATDDGTLRTTEVVYDVTTDGTPSTETPLFITELADAALAPDGNGGQKSILAITDDDANSLIKDVTTTFTADGTVQNDIGVRETAGSDTNVKTNSIISKILVSTTTRNANGSVDTNATLPNGSTAVAKSDENGTVTQTLTDNTGAKKVKLTSALGGTTATIQRNGTILLNLDDGTRKAIISTDKDGKTKTWFEDTSDGGNKHITSSTPFPFIPGMS